MSDSVAVIRALPGVGEMLCVVPALRALRAGRPDARLTVVGLPSGRWLADRRDDLIDDWLDLPAWPGVSGAVGDDAQTVALLASSLPPFDLVVQLHGPGGPVNRLAQLLSAGTTVVHVDTRLARPPGGAFGRQHDASPRTRAWPRLVERAWPLEGHEARRLLGLTTAIGSPIVDGHLDLPERPGDLEAADAVWRRLHGRPFVVVHPAARRPAMPWHAQGFAATIRNLAVDGWAVVVVGGGSSRETVARVALASDVRVVPALDLPLGGLAAVLRRASGLVTSDVDIALLAEAVECPVSLISGDVDFDRWGPMDRERNRTRAPSGDLNIDVESVTGDVRSILRRAPQFTRASRGTQRATKRLASPR